MSETAPTFLDVPRLLEQSQPRGRPVWVWYAMTACAVFVLTTTWSAAQEPALRGLAMPMGGLGKLVDKVGMGAFTSHLVRQQRQEQQALEAVEELVQLRRWDEAAALLDGMLSRPTRTGAARVQALVYLCSVLGRYHRFADVMAVHDYLLAHAQFDASATHSLKLMRTMAMLHEDHLFDADRAINELRREAPESGGLALVELYRDVKTGHASEAIDLFRGRLPALRGQLGNRLGDAYALAARAYDLLGREAEAAAEYERATLLANPEELIRRYPELGAMKGKYRAAEMPKEAA
jgi:tetratricopeptide (TPR) repeat protein